MSSSSCHIGTAVDFIELSSNVSVREQENGARREKNRNHVLNTMIVIIGKCQREQKRNKANAEEESPIVACDKFKRFRTLATKCYTDSSENVLDFLLLLK